MNDYNKNEIVNDLLVALIIGIFASFFCWHNIAPKKTSLSTLEPILDRILEEMRLYYCWLTSKSF